MRVLDTAIELRSEVSSLASTDHLVALVSGTLKRATPAAVGAMLVGVLGTAAFVNTGTSGATIPLLNGTNTWSGVQTLSLPAMGGLRFQGSGGSQSGINWYQDDGSVLWALGNDGDANSNAFFLNRYNTSGVFQDRPFEINLTTGVVALSAVPTAGGNSILTTATGAQLTAANTFTLDQTIGNGNAVAANRVLALNAHNNYSSIISFQSNAGTRWLLGRNIGGSVDGNVLQLFNVAVGYALQFSYSNNEATFGHNVKWGGGVGTLTFSGSDSYLNSTAGILLRPSDALQCHITNGGTVFGAPTGSFKGTGTINAAGVYDDNTLLTDLVLDLRFRGWFDRKVYADHPISDEIADWWFDPKRYIHFISTYSYLPGMISWKDEQSRPSVGALTTRLTGAVETLAVLFTNHEERIERIEAWQATQSH